MDQKSNTGVVGKPVNRVEGRLKVTGQARYAGDTQIENAAYGALIQSTIPTGRILQFDTSEARKVPGFIDVLTFENRPKMAAEKTKPMDIPLPLLEDNKVYHDRQNIGVVLAESVEAAQQAAALVKVNYRKGKFQTDMDKNVSAAYEPPTVWSPPNSSRGDVKQGLSQGSVKLDQTYTTPSETHNPMEPFAAVASWNGDNLTVHTTTQAVFSERNRLARLFQIEPEKVHILSKFVGGGFGCKLTTWTHVVLAAAAAKLINRPVKMVIARGQMFGPVGFRPKVLQTIKIAATKDGKLTAIAHDCLNETSTFDDYLESSAAITRTLYACPNVSTSHKLVPVDIGTPTWMRAPGQAPGSFALEAAMDELASALKMDPIELRLANYANTDQQSGLPWSSNSLRECYKLGSDAFGWSKRNPAPGSMKDGKKLIGWGMSTAAYPVHMMSANCKARLLADGTAVVQSGSQDIGTGTYTIMTQIAADCLGLPADKIKFELGDSDLPQSPLSGGSMTAASVGSAVKIACDNLIIKLKSLSAEDTASPLHGLAVEELIASDGTLTNKDGSRKDSYEELLKRNKKQHLDATGKSDSGDASKKYGMHGFGAHFAEVTVDPELGTIRVTRWTSAFACGKILNAKTARSQMIGGIIGGLGMALFEETLMDHNLGRCMNADLAEYHVPVHADVPNIQILFVDEHDPHVNPLGVKGIGEISITGVAAAITNAVYHATGKRIRDLPITLDKVFA